MERRGLFKRLFPDGNKVSLSSHRERDYKAQMLFELVPVLYLNGTFPAVRIIEAFLNDIEAGTGLRNRVLLARALDDQSRGQGHLGATSHPLGRDESFSKIVRQSQPGGEALIVINRDHPALDFSLQKAEKEKGFPLEPAVALALFKTMVAAQAEQEKQARV